MAPDGDACGAVIEPHRVQRFVHRLTARSRAFCNRLDHVGRVQCRELGVVNPAWRIELLLGQGNRFWKEPILYTMYSIRAQKASMSLDLRYFLASRTALLTKAIQNAVSQMTALRWSSALALLNCLSTSASFDRCLFASNSLL